MTKKRSNKLATVVAIVVLPLIFVALAAAIQTSAQAQTQTQTQAQDDTPLVTTRTGLLNAVYAAEDGDTIHVGDIEFHDFQPGDQILSILKRITVDKSITIKSGKPDGSRAVLSGGSFVIAGPIRGTEKITCTFENIVFDGGIDGSELVAEDWDLVDTEPEPLKAQYAATFKGNVDAVYVDCDITRYMFPYGGALWGSYSNYDWTSPGDFLYDYRDNKLCSLSISLKNCNFFENSAYYAGGAIYLEGEGGNVSLKAENSTFHQNNSSVGFYDNKEGYRAWYGEGGGAIYIRRVDASFYDCSITANTANRVYGPANQDATRGGGITCHGSTLEMVNCLVADNVASIGGGICLTYTEAVFDGCAITGNRAFTDAVFYYEGLVWDEDLGDWVDKLTDQVLTGLRTFAGFAGAIYADIEAPISVLILNSEISGNSAQNAYGGFFAYYADWFEPIPGFGKVDIAFSTYMDNRCGYVYDYEDGAMWGTLPGDVWEIPYLTVFGSVIIDEDMESVFPRYEKPDEGNGYTYYAPSNTASSDGVLKEGLLRPVFDIPSAVVKTVYDGRLQNSVGQFYIGRNYNPEVTLLLDADGGTGVGAEMAYRYGSEATLPIPNKEGYVFEGWYDSDGAAFSTERLVFAVDVKTHEIHAKWALDENEEQHLGTVEFPYGITDEDEEGATRERTPPWLSTLLIVIGSAALVVAAVLLFLRRRQAALAKETVNRTAFSPPVQDGVTIDDIAAHHNLTAREKEVAALLVNGKSQKEIADELFISTETVKTHVKNVYSKLGVKSKYELFAKLRN